MTLDLSTLYRRTGQAKLARWGRYLDAALQAVPPGVDLILTGPGPIWLYLRLAHALHGRVRALYYESPVTGPVRIFDHDPGVELPAEKDDREEA